MNLELGFTLCIILTQDRAIRSVVPGLGKSASYLVPFHDEIETEIESLETLRAV